MVGEHIADKQTHRQADFYDVRLPVLDKRGVLIVGGSEMISRGNLIGGETRSKMSVWA